MLVTKHYLTCDASGTKPRRQYIQYLGFHSLFALLPG